MRPITQGESMHVWLAALLVLLGSWEVAYVTFGEGGGEIRAMDGGMIPPKR